MTDGEATETKGWVSPNGMAMRLGWGRSTIMREIEAGRIKSQKTPRGQHRITVAEMRRYMADVVKTA